MRYTPLAALLALAPALAAAGSVYLNNVNIDGITDQRFEKATVRIDAKGNVFIDAPGYAARTAGAGATPARPPAEPPKITRRYWLFSEQVAQGMTQFDIDVYVNSRWLRKLRSDEDQVVSEITRSLLPGRNTVLLAARKVLGGARKSFAPEHVFRVTVGEGNVGGDNVMIDTPLVRFEVNASQGNDLSQEFVFTAR